ncbi:hypothetical protein B296_00045499 [Ensete ventricosum]|uniref:Uncharacterized protein n=1 Tax=Ensete ventricosum TaxID=4639 RepID=A0A426YVX9_ENSVE|nr:hypothetical protein B296_00045499 [Ensete ventricosum]
MRAFHFKYPSSSSVNGRDADFFLLPFTTIPLSSSLSRPTAKRILSAVRTPRPSGQFKGGADSSVASLPL